MRNRSIFIGSLLAAVWLIPAGAFADSYSPFTIGVGSGFGFYDAKDAPMSPAAEFKARLRLLYGLGLELAYNPMGTLPTEEGLVYDSDLRMSGLLYIVPTTPVGAYLKAGVGGASFGEMLTLNSDQSYHGGGGLDFYVGEHVVISSEVLMLMPGISYEDRPAGAGAISGADRMPQRGFNHDSFRVTFSLMYFI